MSEKLLKQIQTEITKLSRKVDKLERDIDQIHREVGAASGRVLSQQIDELGKFSGTLKAEVDKIKIDTTSIRKNIEFGSRETGEIKKALAAIYRNTDELEGYIVPEGERRTS